MADKTPVNPDDHNKENFTKTQSGQRRSTGLQCSYLDCPNRYYTANGQRTTFHFFSVPLINPEKVIWCNKMGKIEGKDGFNVTKNTKVCHVHFQRENIQKVAGGTRWNLKQGARPQKHGFTTPEKRKSPMLRNEYIKPRKLKFSGSNIANLHQPKSLVNISLLAMKTAYQETLDKNNNLKCELEKTRKELKITAEKLNKNTFGIDVVIKNDKLCKHYTGFPNYERIKVCFNFLRAGDNGQNVRMKNANGGQTRRPRAMSAEDQFFLVLLKLRTGFSNIHCGWLFNCDESTVSRTVCSWLNFMFLQFTTLPIWPTREEINESMPESFKRSFPKTRVIIDCTELFVEAPESLHLRSTFYSDYKHHNTYKALIGITPAGGLSFVSELFPGSVSDREIVSRCGILNPKFWDKDDEVMADKGFTIRDLLDPLGVKLNIPIFLEDQMQFSANQVCINQRIATQRIHVERYIGRIKNFGIFDKPIPVSMHGSGNQIFTICSFLVMFQDPIISAC